MLQNMITVPPGATGTGGCHAMLYNTGRAQNHPKSFDSTCPKADGGLSYPTTSYANGMQKQWTCSRHSPAKITKNCIRRQAYSPDKSQNTKARRGGASNTSLQP